MRYNFYVQESPTYLRDSSKANIFGAVFIMGICKLSLPDINLWFIVLFTVLLLFIFALVEYLHINGITGANHFRFVEITSDSLKFYAKDDYCEKIDFADINELKIERTNFSKVIFNTVYMLDMTIMKNNGRMFSIKDIYEANTLENLVKALEMRNIAVACIPASIKTYVLSGGKRR